MTVLCATILFIASMASAKPSTARAVSSDSTVKVTAVARPSAPAGAETEPPGDDPHDVTSAPYEGLGSSVRKGAQQVEKAIEHGISNAGDRRETSSAVAMLEFSPFDLILPSKLGGSVGYVRSRSTTYELEYLGTSLSSPFFVKNIGGFEDRRVSLVERQYSQWNSLGFEFGISYFDVGIHVGNEFLKTATQTPSFDLMRSRSIGFIVGVGHRWVFPHGFTLGVDWFSWAQPVFVLQEDSSIINSIQDEGAKQTLQNAFHYSMFLPRLTLLKLALGLTF